MVYSARLERIYTGLAIALVLFTATLDRYVAIGAAAALLLIGLILFPALRGVGIRAAVIALAVAAVVALSRSGV